MRSVRSVLQAATFLAPLIVAACSQQPASPTGALLATSDCPLTLPGVNAVYAETTEGLSFDLNGPADQIAEIRARARKLVRDRELGFSQACPCGAVETAQGGTEQTLAPAANASSEDTATGARVSFMARDRSDIVLLRAHIRRYVEMIQEGRCGKEYPEVAPAR